MTDHMAVDRDGRPLPFTSEEVRGIVQRAVDDGDILVLIVRVRNDLAVQVFGRPSQEILDCLEQTARAYRHALEGS